MTCRQFQARKRRDFGLRVLKPFFRLRRCTSVPMFVVSML